MNYFQSLNLFFLFHFSFFELEMLNGQISPAIDTISFDTIPAFSVTADPAFIYASRLRNPFTVSSIDEKKINNQTEPTI